MLSHLFTTPVLREQTKLTEADRRSVCEYLLGLREASPGEQKSNRGGWHSKGNLFGPEYGLSPAVRDTVTQALFSYIGDAFGFSGEIQISITGWAVINRPGDYNVPHNHAANLLSGALYLSVPPGMKGGAIVFQDPRLNLNAHDTEGMRRLNVKPPWMATSLPFVPAEGEILVFPSWLNHWVEPYRSENPDALRIVVSFNATVG